MIGKISRYQEGKKGRRTKIVHPVKAILRHTINGRTRGGACIKILRPRLSCRNLLKESTPQLMEAKESVQFQSAKVFEAK
jgi:hypothetical protein